MPKETQAQRHQNKAGRYQAKYSQKKRKSSGKKFAIGAIVISFIAIVIAVAAGYLYFLNEDLDGIILKNISVAGVDVGGMSQAEAIEAVKAATSNTYGTTAMVVKVLDAQAELKPEWCGSLNVKAAIRDAYNFGNTGSETKKQKERQIAMEEGYVVDIIPYLQINTDAIKTQLAALGENYNTTLSQSTYEITGKKPNQTLIITLGEPEYGLNLNDLFDKVMASYNVNTFFTEGECGMIEPDPIDLESIYNANRTAPIDASFDKNTFEVIEGTDGYGFDLEKAKETLASADFGQTIKIPFCDIKPEITSEDLKSMLYRDTLSTYTAVSDSESNRDTNLRLACEAINGLTLYPGDVFSYNDALGERTEARGYKPGPSYAGNQTLETIGGGICQVSSSLYYCAMVADLEILLRDNHGFATTYMPLGMDATVSWGSLDFRFRNNSDFPIKITAEATGGTVVVSILGTDTKDHYVKMEYNVLATYHYDTTYKTLSPDNAEGYADGDYIVDPYTGYDIKTYRCKYSKETNELITKDFEASSSYRRRDAVICKIEDFNTTPTESTVPETSIPDTHGIGGGAISDDPGALPPE